jgi:hypothetical protein
MILLYYSLDTEYGNTQVNMCRRVQETSWKMNQESPKNLLEDESKDQDNIFVDVSYK